MPFTLGGVILLKTTVLALSLLLGLSGIARVFTRRDLRILCYHGLWVTPGPEFGNCTFIDPAQFERRMEMLRKSRRPVLPLAEALERLERNDLPPAAVVITIDDAWVSTHSHMLPVLEAHGFPATIYATTWYTGHRLPVVNVALDYLRTAAGRLDIDLAARRAEIEALPVDQRLEALRAFGAGLGVPETWLETRQFELMDDAELIDASRRGFDIQLHTHRHVEIDQNLAALPREVADNRAYLSRVFGREGFDHFCYPNGSYHPEATATLIRQGIRSAMGTKMGLNSPGCDIYNLRRLVECRNITDMMFRAYLDGTLHLFGMLKAWGNRPRILRAPALSRS